MMMSLMLCQGLKAFLTSNYAVETKELAVPSFQHVINDNYIKIIYNKGSLNGFLKEYSFLNQRIPKESLTHIRRLVFSEIAQMKSGKAVIFCQTVSCRSFMIFNPHLPLAMTNDHIGLDFYTLIIPIDHIYAKEFHRL